MHIHEVIRGLSLGGAETLLALRLEARAAESPAGERRTVFNAAPSHDYYRARVAACVDGYDVAATDSTVRGVVELFRAARQIPAGSVVVVHSPAASIGYKLHSALCRRTYTLVEVAHNTRYRPVYVWLGRLLNRYVDLCICVSSEVANSETTLGYRVKRTILGGVDAARMREWKDENPQAHITLRESLGMVSGERLLVNVGNLNSRKNQAMIIEAMTHMDPGIHLAILGEGPERPRLQTRIDELGLSQVHLLGSQPDAWRWIAAADLMVHPSLHEGLPVVMMEAMTIGTPVLATQCGGMADLLERANGLSITSAQDSVTLADDMVARLRTLEPITETWNFRLTAPSFWDVQRYSREFYASVLSI